MLKNILLSYILFTSGLIFAGGYTSQCDQDRYLNETFFFNKRNGVFVDIGAHDGIRYSNSYFFEKELFWTGICIEPLPNVFEKLKQNRSCILVNKCISSQTGTEAFLWIHDNDIPNIDGSMLSGLQRTFDPRHFARAEQHANDIGGSIEIVNVPSININELLDEHKLYYIDYLSVDTEGSELEILHSIDFDRFYIYTISVENNFSSPEIRAFLMSKGFEYITNLDVDEIYRNSKTQ